MLLTSGKRKKIFAACIQIRHVHIPWLVAGNQNEQDRKDTYVHICTEPTLKSARKVSRQNACKGNRKRLSSHGASKFPLAKVRKKNVAGQSHLLLHGLCMTTRDKIYKSNHSTVSQRRFLSKKFFTFASEARRKSSSCLVIGKTKNVGASRHKTTFR